MRKLLLNILIFLCKLFLGMAIVGQVKSKLGSFMDNAQDTMKVKVKKLSGILLLICSIWILLSLGFRFLLLGLATWLNNLLYSKYIGFFIVAILCFLVALLMARVLYKKLHTAEAHQEQ